MARTAFHTDLPVVSGESLGSRRADRVDRVRRPPSALVLRSPFTSLSDIARNHYPVVPTVLLRDSMQSRRRCRGCMCRSSSFSARATRSCRPELSRRVFDAAAGPKQLVEMEDLDHNDPELSAGEWPRSGDQELRRAQHSVPIGRSQ